MMKAETPKGRIFYVEKGNAFSKDLENVQTEYFFSQLCRTGQLSQEEYVLFLRSLHSNDNTTEICIEEYKLEYGLSKHKYYSLVSWEEIKNEISGNQVYLFTESSIVMVKVIRSYRQGKTITRKIGFVIGDTNNAT